MENKTVKPLHRNAIDLTGQRFGRLLVLRENGRISHGVAWECQCDCGNIKTVVSGSLTRPQERGGVRSCGCLRREGQVIDMTNQRFGRWVVLRRDYSKCGGHWVCRCDCGTERTIAASPLRRKETTSCGCKAKEKSRSKHREYFIWKAMLTRCENPNHASYARYGARGIKICARWHDFDSFLSDMGSRPSPQHSIDRIDPNGHYEPGNVRWSDWKTQANNRALSEIRVVRVLDEISSLIDDGEETDPRAVISLVRAALLGIQQ